MISVKISMDRTTMNINPSKELLVTRYNRHTHIVIVTSSKVVQNKFND